MIPRPIDKLGKTITTGIVNLHTKLRVHIRCGLAGWTVTWKACDLPTSLADDGYF